MIKVKPILIEYISELYPKKLKKIKNPPSRLYVFGNVEILNETRNSGGWFTHKY